MTAKEFFEEQRGNGEYCKILQGIPEDQQIAWEIESASQHSPGPVQDEEMLCRQVLDPVHFDSVSGTIKPSFFDDASGKGASCHRLQHTTIAEIRRIAEARVTEANQNPPATGPRLLIGYATISAKFVRSVLTSQPTVRRGAAVYDTAKPDDVSHADICQIVSGKQVGKSVRAQLFQAAKSTLVRF